MIARQSQHIAVAVFLLLCLNITSTKAAGLVPPLDSRSLINRLDQCKTRPEGYNSCPCYSLSGVKYPVGWEELTLSEQCQVKGRCNNKPKCCIELCEKGSRYICESETDCKTIDQTGRWLACKADQRCEQWNYDECASNDPGKLKNIRGIQCFCRVYNKSCANV